jgi:hypothetical protein
VKGGIIAGFNLSQVDGDEVYGFTKFGINAGVGAEVPFAKNFSFSIETLFSQKGAIQGKQYENVDSAGIVTTGQYKLQLDYLEVPVLVQYNDKDIIMAGLGFSYGRLVNVKEYEHGNLVETTTLNGGPYERNDFNILADVRFKVYKRFKFNIRYAYSIVKIRTREFENFLGETWERDQYNNLISFRVIYMFNEKPRLADDKKDE